jgi:hypothetical protein
MNNLYSVKNEIVLNVVSNQAVTWAMVKLCSVYRYIGAFI